MDALAEVQRHDTEDIPWDHTAVHDPQHIQPWARSQEPWSLSLAALACMSVQVGRQIKPLSQRPCTRSLSCQYVFPYHLQTLSYILMPCHFEYQHPGRTLNIKRKKTTTTFFFTIEAGFVKVVKSRIILPFRVSVGPIDLSVFSCFNYVFLSSPDIYASC